MTAAFPFLVAWMALLTPVAVGGLVFDVEYVICRCWCSIMFRLRTVEDFDLLVLALIGILGLFPEPQ